MNAIRDEISLLSPSDSSRPALFLAAASRLLASSLDVETTLENIARAAVPEFADWCAVDLMGENGCLRRVAIEHSDPRKVRLARQLHEKMEGKEFAGEREHGRYKVVRTGEPDYMRRLPTDLIRKAAADEEHRALLEQLQLHSYVVEPIVGRGKILGTITFVYAESGREYSEDDVALVGDLAARAGTALENARLVEELRRARDAAEQANRSKSEFLAVMSHELRTPLNAIIGYAELIGIEMEGGGSIDDVLGRVGRIRASARHLEALISEILEWARLDSGREHFEFSAVDPIEVAREALDVIEPLAISKGLELRTSLSPRTARVFADPNKLRQALLNLLSNAVKFTETGSVSLRVHDADSLVVLEVEDTGPGIDEEDQERVFEPFTQGDASPTRVAGGAGLGLAVCRRIIEGLGGVVGLTSTPGQGSRFALSLPVATSASPAQRRSVSVAS